MSNSKSGANKSKAQKQRDSAEKAAPIDATDKVERIRELIFGQQTRDYAQKFETLQSDLARLQEEINRLSDALQAHERTTTQALRDQEQRLQQQQNELDQRLTQLIQDVDRQHRQESQELWQAVRALEDNTRSELRQTAQELDELKMDRFTLGEFFMQLGRNLKESKPDQEAAGLLEELSDELGVELE